MIMRKLTLLFGLLFTFVLQAQTYNIPKYDIQAYGTGKEGYYTAEVFIYQDKPDKGADDNLRKAAVHGVIFKGLAPANDSPAQRPLAKPSAETDNPEFFGKFFGNGDCNNYVSIISSSKRVEKVEKKLYRIRAVVSVSKDLLRKELEKNKIVRSFSDIF